MKKGKACVYKRVNGQVWWLFTSKMTPCVLWSFRKLSGKNFFRAFSPVCFFLMRFFLMGALSCPGVFPGESFAVCGMPPPGCAGLLGAVCSDDENVPGVLPLDSSVLAISVFAFLLLLFVWRGNYCLKKRKDKNYNWACRGKKWTGRNCVWFEIRQSRNKILNSMLFRNVNPPKRRGRGILYSVDQIYCWLNNPQIFFCVMRWFIIIFLFLKIKKIANFRIFLIGWI